MANQALIVADYERLIHNALENFISGSEALGEPLTSLSTKVKRAFMKQFELITYGVLNLEPTDDQSIKSAFMSAISEVVNFQEEANSQFSNHVKAVKEAIIALGWIFVKKAPTQYIRDMRDAGCYYSNRVLQNFKGNDKHAYFVRLWLELLNDLHEYVKKHFLTGFVWGKASGGIPPPPPPPPAPLNFPGAGDTRFRPDFGGDRQALLAELNKGSQITNVLRPRHAAPTGVRPPGVSSGEMKPKGALTAQRGPTAATQRLLPTPPPKFALEGRKWIVEFHKDISQQITIDNQDMAESVSVYKCDSASLEVKNKINSVTLDSCKKVNVSLKDVISSVELIRCESLKIQCNAKVPLINLDNCDSCEIYLTKEARDVEIISSKCNSCNVCLLEPDGNYREISIPEQIKTVIQDDKLVSAVVEKI